VEKDALRFELDLFDCVLQCDLCASLNGRVLGAEEVGAFLLVVEKIDNFLLACGDLLEGRIGVELEVGWQLGLELRVGAVHLQNCVVFVLVDRHQVIQLVLAIDFYSLGLFDPPTHLAGSALALHLYCGLFCGYFSQGAESVVVGYLTSFLFVTGLDRHRHRV
jgi:hypothetical protein